MEHINRDTALDIPDFPEFEDLSVEKLSADKDLVLRLEKTVGNWEQKIVDAMKSLKLQVNIINKVKSKLDWLYVFSIYIFTSVCLVF